MSCLVTYRINSGCKMFLSVQQLMRNTVIKNRKMIMCRGFNTLTKSSESCSIVNFSRDSVKQTIIKEKWKLDLLQLRGQQYIACLDFTSYSKKCNMPNSSVTQEQDNKKLTLFQKVKKMYKEYWYVALPMYFVTSSVWFGSFYYLAASGFDISSWLEALGAPASWIALFRDSKAGNFVLAVTLYKIVTPLRYTVLLATTTLAIHYLKKWGMIKPVNKNQFTRMYQERKGALSELKASYQDKMQVTKDEFLKTKVEMKKQYKEAKEELTKSVQEVKEGFKEGVESAAEEWKHMGRTILRDIKEETKRYKK